MKLAYIVSAYKLPNQLRRLLHRLDSDRTTIVVHVDRKTDDGIYKQMLEGAGGLGSVHFLERHTCHWGGFGHVRATLKAIRHLMLYEPDFDYAVLLTGQDYPLHSRTHTERVLRDAAGRSFMRFDPLPFAEWDPGGGLDRVEQWHLAWRRRLHLRLPLRRRIPGGLAAYGGSGYWCLARDAVEFVDRFVQHNEAYTRFFKHVYVPDELFFQTILMNSPLREAVVNDDLRYVDWSQPRPAILRLGDFEAMVASGKLFARKFDETIDDTVLDALDEHIGREH